MNISRQRLRKILMQEACGCMGIDNNELDDYGYHEEVYDNDSEYGEQQFDDEDISGGGLIDKDSVLRSVAVLAVAVDCPATREVLLSAVKDLIG